MSLASKIVAFARVQLLATYFGRSVDADAFAIAFEILEFLRHFIAGGTLVSAIIPVYRALVSRDVKDDLARVGSNLINLFTLVLAIVLAFWYAIGPYVFNETMTIFNNRDIDMGTLIPQVISLGNIMFPAIIFLGLVSIGTALLNSFDHFTAPAATPLILNVVTVFFLYSFHNSLGINSLAYGYLIGSLSMVLILLYPLSKRMGKYTFFLSFNEENLKEIWKLLKPLLWGLIAYRLVFLMIKLFAATLGEGQTATLHYSIFFVNSIVDILGISLAMALYPTLSHHYNENNMVKFYKTGDQFLRIMMLFAIPLTVYVMVLGDSLISILLEHGKFTTIDTFITFSTLIILAPTIMFQCFIYIMRNVYYAQRDMVTPVVIAVITLVFNVVLMYFLKGELGTRGIAFATSFAYGLHCFGLLWYIHRKTHLFQIKAFLIFMMKVLITSIVSVGTAFITRSLVIETCEYSRIVEQAIALSAATLVFIVTFYICCGIVKISELSDAFQLVLKKRKK